MLVTFHASHFRLAGGERIALMSTVAVEAGARGAAINDRREIFGWMMYDWANSTFSTTVYTALLGPYLTVLAQNAVGEDGVVLGLGPLGAITAKGFFAICISVSVLLQVFLLPIV